MEQSISEIWTGVKYRELRTRMLNGHRCEIPMCKVCDQISVRSPCNQHKVAEAFSNYVKSARATGKSIFVSNSNSGFCKIIKAFLSEEKILYETQMNHDSNNKTLVLCVDSKDALSYTDCDVFDCSEVITPLLLCRNHNRTRAFLRNIFYRSWIHKKIEVYRKKTFIKEH